MSRFKRSKADEVQEFIQLDIEKSRTSPTKEALSCALVEPFETEESKPLESNTINLEESNANASEALNNPGLTFQHMCRVCMCKGENFNSIYDITGKSLKISEMLFAITPKVLLSETDVLPKLICLSCMDKLTSAYQFQKIYIASDEYMRSILLPKFISISQDQNRDETVSLDIAFLETDELADSRESVKEEMNDEEVNKVTDDSRDKQTDPLLAGDNSKVQNEVKSEMNDEELIDIDLVKASDSKIPQNTLEILIHNDETNSSAIYSAGSESDSDEYSDYEKNKILTTRKGKQTKVAAAKSYKRKNKEKTERASKTKLTCKKCDQTFNSLRTLRRHTISHKQKSEHELAADEVTLSIPKSLKCPDCPRRFRKSVSLSAHIEQHRVSEKGSDLVFRCDLCPKVFHKYPNLAQHARTHKENQTLKCNVCEKTFARSSKLDDHMKRHNGLRQFPCENCDKAFYTKVALKSHQRIHTGEKPFLCPQCGKAFVGAGNLHQHMLRHSTVKRYQCPECPDKFTCLSDRSIHMSIHREIKRHVCDICGSSFTRAFTLAKHKIVHTGERPFKCEECNMTFVYIERMKRHMLTHTGEKRHKCEYCDRAYTASGDLNKHLRRHVGEKTYRCKQCPEAFKYQTELREHIRYHYKMEQQQQKHAEQECEQQNVNEPELRSA